MDKNEKVYRADSPMMGKKSEETNKKVYEAVLPYFYPSEMTHDRLIKAYDGPLDKTDQYLEDLIGLDSQRRAYFEIDATLLGELDQSYKIYNDALRETSNERKIAEICKLMKTGDIGEKAELFRAICDYQNYKVNRILFKKNTHKLFKVLLNSGFIDKQLEERISQARASLKNLRLVISRNPIDYLMCSTGQSFTSCMSILSETRSCYYMGLPYLTLDPNRAVIFLTDGIKEYNLIDTRSLDSKHPLVMLFGPKAHAKVEYFNMLQRSWLLLDKSSNLIIVRNFDNTKVRFTDILNEYKGYKDTNIYHAHSLDDYIDGKTVGKFPFNIGVNKGGYVASIYLDNVSAESKLRKKGKIKTPKELETENHITYIKGGGGTVFPHSYPYQWGKKLTYLVSHNIHKFTEFENMSGKWRCKECNGVFNSSSSSGYPGPDGKYHCSECFNDLYSKCKLCGAAYKKGEGFSFHKYKSMCENCYTSKTTSCGRCGNRLKGKETEESNYSERHSALLCTGCLEEEKSHMCTCCGDYMERPTKRSDGTRSTVCRGCQRVEKGMLEVPDYAEYSFGSSDNSARPSFGFNPTYRCPSDFMSSRRET